MKHVLQLYVSLFKIPLQPAISELLVQVIGGDFSFLIPKALVRKGEVLKRYSVYGYNFFINSIMLKKGQVEVWFNELL